MTEIIRLQTVLSQELTRRFERKAALAFTDVVDSTRYFAQFGDEAGRRLQQLHLDLLEKSIDGAGRIVDTAGDGAFISFPSAMAAVGAMVEREIGYGERRPIATNSTAAGMQKNRRVEVVCYRW